MIINNFDKKIIDILEKIGFTKILRNRDVILSGEVLEYLYYPDYFIDKHYTLIVFKSSGYTEGPGGKRLHEHDMDKDYRLYIHNNLDGSYVDSPFQISTNASRNNDFIEKRLRSEFRIELRNYKLETIL